ncbi:angiopoietin-related protein 3 [Heptranchias perlo]|uniref:angiopoietin-related protein 3 n=1 Tax=Heptranchias perlo TaxID=212740 RepID=UPI0035594055
MKMLFTPFLILALSSYNVQIQADDSQKGSRFAMLDDVRILANGLLQLGHGLKDFVQKTKNQVNEIFDKINIFDRSFFELSKQTDEIKLDEQELKKRTIILQANNEELKNMSLDIREKINGIVENRTVLETKVDGLEDKLSKLTEIKTEISEIKEIPSLKALIEEQNKNIKSLISTIHDQHSQLDKQTHQILKLEEKLRVTFLQDNHSDSQPQKPPTSKYILYFPRNNTQPSSDYNDLPTDCNDIYNGRQNNSGVYTIKPNGYKAFNVYCQLTAEGGWTVIQRRFDGSVDFDQLWQHYENGFGTLEGEFWLGLKKVHHITQQGDYILHIELEDWKSEKRFIKYIFSLEERETDYTLQISDILLGNLLNAMTEQAGMKFSTKDRDNDMRNDTNCAESYSGGWWFNTCGGANLNGKYIKVRSKGKPERRKGIFWITWKGKSYSLKSTKMMIRPSNSEKFD